MVNRNVFFLNLYSRQGLKPDDLDKIDLSWIGDITRNNVENTTTLNSIINRSFNNRRGTLACQIRSKYTNQET